MEGITLALAQYVNIDGLNVHINIIGEGEPIIFLHGGPGGEHRFFLPHVLPLSKKYKLVLYDQRGCGKSDPTSNNEYSIDDEVRTLELLRMQLKLDKLNLFGESWGSMLALCYATTYPEKVNKLFLTAAIGINQRGFKTFEKELLKKISLKDKIKLIRTERNLNKKTASVEDLLDIIDPYYVYSPKNLLLKNNCTMNHTVNHVVVEDIEDKYDITDKVDRLTDIPILVAQGSHDILSPSLIKKLLIDYIPHARLHEIENCGHWTVIEKASEINTLAQDFFNN